jgi:predicted HicB family RNase H-like nuclease
MTARRKPKLGRPAKAPADKLSGMIRVPVRPDTEAAVTAAAKHEGQSIADWGRAAFELALARGSTR